MLLFDAQTSGGLLLAVPPQKLDPMLRRAASLGQLLWVVGEALRGRFDRGCLRQSQVRLDV